MRQITKSYLSLQSLTMVTLSIFVSCSSFGSTGRPTINAWKKYSAEEKTQSIVGFIHCYRTAVSEKDAFAQTEIAAIPHMVDAALANSRDGNIGNLILDALKKAPRAKADKHAEHWDEPYGFNDGMWWRGVEEQDRAAYVQGVFWCAEAAPAKTVSVSEKSVTAAVRRLNDWYLVADDDWKDSRSGKRADVPVISAMQQIGILSKVNSKIPE